MYLAPGKIVWSPTATFGGVIDVSHWNGPINWREVPASIVMVMIKATQGVSNVDPRFQANLGGALGTARLVVPYHFLTDDPVQAQLDNLIRVVGHLRGPIMIDWEGQPRPPAARMEAFGALVASAIGRPPLAYHGMYDPSSPKIQAWPWMLPKYGPAPHGVKYLFWQDRPNLHVPGISALVDHSIFSGTEDELRAWHRDGTLPAGF
jgi:GH25 family lysozyme M1 (1,4-beta-N-acetylmuramidase)